MDFRIKVETSDFVLLIFLRNSKKHYNPAFPQCPIATELENVNNVDVITPEFKFKKVPHHSISQFKLSFDNLTLVIRKGLRPKVPVSSSSQTNTPHIQSTVPPVRFHTSPSQPPIAVNPRFSSSSTVSTSSRESKAEHYTQIFAHDFLWATLESIEDNLEKFQLVPRYRVRTSDKVFPSQLCFYI